MDTATATNEPTSYAPVTLIGRLLAEGYRRRFGRGAAVAPDLPDLLSVEDAAQAGHAPFVAPDLPLLSPAEDEARRPRPASRPRRCRPLWPAGRHRLAESARGAEAPASAPVPAKWFLWDYPDEPGFNEWKASRERAYFGEPARPDLLG